MEEDGFVLTAAGARFLNARQRWILADVLRDAGGVSYRGCDLVAHDAEGRRLLGVGACTAGEEEAVVDFVFAREEKVGALRTKAEEDFLGVLLLLAAARCWRW